jgi:hypothetical protein
MQTFRLFKKFLNASVCALLAYCLLTMTLSPAWVLIGVIPYGLIFSLAIAFPIYLYLQHLHCDNFIKFWLASASICLSFGIAALSLLDARTVLAFAMPMSAGWNFPLGNIVVYWLLVLALVSGVGSWVITRQSSTDKAKN